MFGTNPFGVPYFSQEDICSDCETPFRAGDAFIEWYEGSSSSSSTSVSLSSSSTSSSSLSSSSSKSSSSSSLSSSSSFSSSSSTSNSSSSTVFIVCDFVRNLIENDGIQSPCNFRYDSAEVCECTPALGRQYTWEVFDNLTDEKLAELDSTSDYFIYAWPYESEFRIKLTIFDPIGGFSCFIEKVYFDEECFEVILGGGGGGAPPYKKDEEPPICNIKIIKITLTDMDNKVNEQLQKISVKEIKLE